MTVPELVEYVRQQSQAGVSAQELRETLMAAGWTEFDVDNALHDVAAGLKPVTVGASIHEDLAQVRGLVAHLTARVGRLESRLVNAPGTPMLTNPEPALPAPRRHWWGYVFGILIVAIASIGAGGYLSGVAAEQASQALQWSGAAVLVLALFGWFSIRSRRAWTARYSVAMAVALGAWCTWLAWNSFQFIEWTTALAIGVFLVVLLVVAARWINRIEH